MKFLTIPFSQAFAHCATTTSFLVCIIIGLIVAALIVFFTIKSASSGDGWKTPHSLFVFLAIAIAVGVFVYRPGEVSANTTPSEAARGVFIGY